MNLLSRKVTVLAVAGAMGMSGLSGCASLNNTERGGVIGAGTGAAVGGVIGKQTGAGTARGAIIGAVLGGAAGAIIGRRMDNQARELETALPNAEVERVGEGIAVTFASGILFPFNSTDIAPAGRGNLQQLAQSLSKYPGTTVLIVGHTDNVGSDSYNMTLSQRRADAAASFLSAQGVSRSRVRIEGRGETEPIASNANETGRGQNRRVEIAIFADEAYRQQILRENGGRAQ